MTDAQAASGSDIYMPGPTPDTVITLNPPALPKPDADGTTHGLTLFNLSKSSGVTNNTSPVP